MGAFERIEHGCRGAGVEIVGVDPDREDAAVSWRRDAEPNERKPAQMVGFPDRVLHESTQPTVVEPGDDFVDVDIRDDRERVHRRAGCEGDLRRRKRKSW